MTLKFSYEQTLYLLYARIHDLERRQRIAPIETDKIRAISTLIDKVLLSRIGISHEEASYHKLHKYLPDFKKS